jgi:site-specific recombinase XerD
VTSELEPLAPDEAVEMWLTRQSSEKADETVQSYGYRIKHFVRWCDEEGFENLNELTPRDVYHYDTARREQNLSRSTLNNQLGTLRQFLAFCVDLNAVTENVAAAVDVPSMEKGHRVNEEKLAEVRAWEILDKLDTYRYASREHALLAVAWDTGCRLGGLRALDVGDVYLADEDLDRLRHYPEMDETTYKQVREEVSPPFVYFRHRERTPLKNGVDGQRPVSLRDEPARVLRGYLRVNRVTVTDDADRAPVFSTEKGNGRMSKGAMRRVFNMVTQPCRFGEECPHGRDVETCEAREHGYEARCPSARSPHPVRTGSITWHRDEGWPPDVLSERVNATPEVIREHYDHPQLLRRMESRRHYLTGANTDE